MVRVPSLFETDETPPVIVLHPNPVPEVQLRAFVAPPHEGIANPDGVVAVKAPSTVFADRLGNWPSVADPEMSVNAGCVWVKFPVPAL
jgi:hypothetical protein